MSLADVAVSAPNVKIGTASISRNVHDPLKELTRQVSR
jgi:hypothetical protein